MKERVKLSRWLAPLAAAATICGFSNVAAAQSTTEPGSVSGSGKGIVGGGLLGAEVVMLPMGIAGLKPWWPYVVFGSVGAVGGAVGGWAVEQADPPAEAPLYMLAGGLALVIPTLVATLAAVTDDDIDDEVPEETIPGAPGSESVTVKTSRRKQRPAMVGALFGIDAFGKSTGVTMGVPAVSVSPEYTPEEVNKYRVQQQTIVDVPVVRGTF